MGKRISIEQAMNQIRASGAGGILAGQQSPQAVLAEALKEERRLGNPLDQRIDEDVLQGVILLQAPQHDDATITWWAQDAPTRTDLTKKWSKDPGLTPQGALLLAGVVVTAATLGAAVLPAGTASLIGGAAEAGAAATAGGAGSAAATGAAALAGAEKAAATLTAAEQKALEASRAAGGKGTGTSYETAKPGETPAEIRNAQRMAEAEAKATTRGKPLTETEQRILEGELPIEPHTEQTLSQAVRQALDRAGGAENLTRAQRASITRMVLEGTGLAPFVIGGYKRTAENLPILPGDTKAQREEKEAAAEEADEPTTLTPQQAAEGVRTGQVKATVTTTDAAGNPVVIPGIDYGQIATQALANEGGSGTFSQADGAYMSALDMEMLSPTALAQMGQTPDSASETLAGGRTVPLPPLPEDDTNVTPIRTFQRGTGTQQGVWFDDQGPIQPIRPDRRQGPIRPGEYHRTAEGKWQGPKIYSYREAVNLPTTLSEEEVMQWSKKLWEAGFLQIPASEFDYTKSFESQWAGDRYDPTFRRAFNTLLNVSMSDPSKSVVQIMDERRKVRAHLIEEQRRKAIEEETKAKLANLKLPDMATISEAAETNMQQLLGRNPTDAERETLMRMITTDMTAQAEAAVRGDQVSSEFDLAARMEDAVERQNPTEYEGKQVADTFDLFAELLGGP